MQNLLASGLHSEWGGPLLPQPTCVSHHELSLLRSKLTQAFHFAHLQNSGLQFGGSELQLRSQYSSEVVPLPMHGRNLSMGPSHAAKSKAAAMGAAVLLCAGASLFGLVALAVAPYLFRKRKGGINNNNKTILETKRARLPTRGRSSLPLPPQPAS